MAVDVGERTTGRHAALPTQFMLGEIPELRRDFGFASLDTAVYGPQADFSWGQPFGSWEGSLSFREQHRGVSISDEHVTKFIDAAYWLVPPREDPEWNSVWTRRAIDAVMAMQQVIRSPDEIERPVLKVPYSEWQTDKKKLPLFVGWVEQMLHAYDYDEQDPWHVVRNDAVDEGADPKDKNPTVIRMGLGPMPLFVIEESVAEQDQYGRRTLWRQFSVTKRYTEAGAVDLLNRPRLAERLRMEQTLEEAGADEEQMQEVLQQANRRTVQSDHDLLALLDRKRNPPPPGRMERLLRAAGAILNTMADSQFMRWVDDRTRWIE